MYYKIRCIIISKFRPSIKSLAIFAVIVGLSPMVAGNARAVPLFLDDGILCLAACPAIIAGNKLTVPTADLIKITKPDGDAALEAAKAIFGATTPEGDTFKSFKDMIMDKAMELGRAIDVVLVGHGSPGSIKLGDDHLDADTKADFVSMVIGKIRSLTLFSCSTGEGDTGAMFLNMLSSNLNRIPVMAYDSCIGIDNGMFYAVGGDSAKLTFMPEPATLTLFGLGLIGLGLFRRRV